MKKVLVQTLAGLAIAVTTSAASAEVLNNIMIYGAATYTRPSNNGLSIGEYQTIYPSQALYSFDRALFLNPGLNWDYFAGISYRLPCTDTRFFVEYDYFNDTDERSIPNVATTLVFPVVAGVSGPTGVPTSVRANVQESSREWRIGFRHFVPFGCRFFVDFSGYFEYDRVTISTHKWNTLNNPVENASSGTILRQDAYYETNSQLRGWGPGVGVKFIGMPFECCPTISLFAGVMTTLFYAKNRYDDHMSVNTVQSGESGASSFPAHIDFIYNPEFTQSILTKLDINFGIDYQRLFCMNGDQFQAGLTVGVRYLNIFNAFKNGNVSGQGFVNVADPFSSGQGGIFLPVYGISNDWGRVGPYIQFRLGGCDA